VFARVETFEADSSTFEEMVESQQHTIGLTRQLSGNMGGFLLVSTDSPKAMSVTYWETEEDRTAAESEFEAAPHHGTIELFSIAMQQARHAV
jgi:heme-degrading monooxygenase HmoA